VERCVIKHIASSSINVVGWEGFRCRIAGSPLINTLPLTTSDFPVNLLNQWVHLTSLGHKNRLWIQRETFEFHKCGEFLD
jgi:hypothetical protein